MTREPRRTATPRMSRRVSSATSLCLLLCMAAGCTGLNPSLLSTLGISPINSLNPQPGVVLTVLINRTAFPAELRIQVFGGDGFSGEEELLTGANSAIITSSDCEISQIQFNSLTVTEASGTETSVTVPTSVLVGGSNFSCGSIVVVTVSGTTGNFEMSTQIR